MANNKIKVTEEVKQIIKKEYISIGPYKLAKQLNLNPKTVYRYGKLFGIKHYASATSQVKLNCAYCNKEIFRTQNYIDSGNKRGRSKFCCSKSCSARKKETEGLSYQALLLANKGKTNKEIAFIMKKSQATVASWLNRKRYRRFASGGQSYTSIKKRLRKEHYHSCQICGFNRIVEIAHIIPAKDGGEMRFENTLGLCPNHHHLFDHNGLTDEEFNKIREKVNASKIKGSA